MFIAETFYLKEAYNKARHYVLWHFMHLLNQEEFLEMESCQLKRIIGDPQLNVTCELDTLSAVMCLINYSKSERWESLAEFLLELSQYCNDRDIELIEQNLGAQKNSNELITIFRTAINQNCHKVNLF